MQACEPRALLFDLGGVVIDIDFARALHSWKPMSPLSFGELKEVLRRDLQYERHERGEIDASTYFDHLATVLKLSGSEDQIAEGWNAIYVGEITETRRMIQAARDCLPCFAFTNTNAAHHAVWTRLFPSVIEAFNRVFASHELGCRKPERRAFELVCREIGEPSESILFFDDLRENVRGAATAGLQTVLVRKPADVRIALQRLGVAVSRTL